MNHKEIKKMEKIEQEIADLEEQVEALQNQIENKKDQLTGFEHLKKEQKYLNYALEQELLLRSLEINKENRNELFNMIKTVKKSLKKDLDNLKEHHKTTQASEEECKEDILAISNEYNWHLDELKNKTKVLDKVIQQQSIQ